MIDKIVKNRFLLYAVIFICAIFTFGGAVNMGLTDFLLATPFMFLWLIVARKAGRKTVITSAIIFLLLILPFFILKVMGSEIYFPANGKEIVLNQDACYNVYTNEHEPPFDDFILASGLIDSEDCLNTNKSISAVKKSKIVAKGTKYTIVRTTVSYADLGEHWYAVVHDEDGKLTIFHPEIFEFSDGSKPVKENLRRPFFYYPSLLMYGPIIPLLLPALLSSGTYKN